MGNGTLSNMEKMHLKRILSIMFLIPFFSCSKCNSKKLDNRIIEVDYDESKFANKEFISFEEFCDDVDTFIFFIETSYAGYEEALKKGMDTNILRERLISKFQKDELISIEKFHREIFELFKPFIFDYHANVIWNGIKYRFIEPFKTYFSDIFVKKINNEYVVIESNIPFIKSGFNYNSEEQYLFKYPAKGKDIYRIGCLSNQNINGLDILFNENIYRISVSKHQKEEKDFNYFYKETEKSVYIKYNRCDCQTEEEYKWLEEFSNFSDECRNKDYLIIDLCGNYGGNDSYGRKFLAELFNKNKDFINFSSRWIYSPATIKSLDKMLNEDGMKDNPELNSLIDELNLYKKKMKKKSKKIIKKYGKEKKLLEKPNFNGTLILITDNNVASSGESFISDAKYLFENTDQIIQIGQNTAGCFLYGNKCTYYLSNSGIEVNLCMTDFSERIKNISSFKGEGIGFYPDYWSTNEDLNDTIYNFTKDNELYELIKNSL